MAEQEKTAEAPKAKKTHGPAHSSRKKSRWTEELCAKAARRFTTEDEWRVGAPASYKAAAARNWVERCTEQMPKTQRPLKRSA